MSINTVKYSMKNRTIRVTFFSPQSVTFYHWNGVAKTTPSLLEAPAKQGIWLDSR